MRQATGLVVEALRASLVQGRMPFLEVTSDSMAPLLRRGDQVGLAAAQPPHLRAGDIVTFLEDGHLTTHRYWGSDHGSLRSRGDRSGIFDRPWTPERLLGRVVMRRRGHQTLALDRGAGRAASHLLYHLSQLERRLLDLGLPRRLVRGLWLALAIPVASAGTLLARGRSASGRPWGGQP